jgi:PAS domain S-box-containing protein
MPPSDPPTSPADASPFSDKLFRDVFERSPVGMLIVAGDGVCVLANQTASAMLGVGADTIVGKDCYGLFLPEDLTEIRKCIRRAHVGKAGMPVDVRVSRGDGSTAWVSVISALVEGANHRLVQLMLTDAADRKRAEADLVASNQVLYHTKGVLEFQKQELDDRTVELEKARRSAEQMNQTRGEFLANMSHEIRTPMTAILGYADMMAEATLSEENRHAAVATIRRNGEHLLGLINDILDIAKIDAGKMTVERLPVDLVDVVTQVEQLLKPRAIDKKLDFGVHFIGDVPRVVRADPLRIRQILMNLIGNSIKFTLRGGVHLNIDCKPMPDGRNMLRLIVTDTGIGMSAEQMSRLFEAFNQLGTATARNFGGTGLGLTISKRLTELMQGHIEVASQAGEGSTFVVTLPVEVVDHTPIASGAKPTPKPVQRMKSSVTLAGRVLIAEDGEDNQKLICYLLKKLGLTPTVVVNGQEAVDELLEVDGKPEAYDLVLIDMEMPVMDGLTATRKIRELGIPVSIVALTANAMASDRERCLAAGCDDYLSKPINYDSFVDVLKKYLVDRESSSQTEVTAPLQQPRPTDMHSLVETYVEELPGQVTRLTRYMQQGNHDMLRKLVQDIKGSGGGYGFDEITAVATNADAMLRLGGDLNNIHKCVLKLISTIRRARGYDAAREEAA